jgi:hypothetical protein
MGSSAHHVSRVFTEMDRRTLVRRLWAGYGSGARCEYCGGEIGPGAVELEAETEAGNLRFHRACHHLWESEPAELPPSHSP